MYKVSRRIKFVDGSMIQDTTKCDLPQEAINWINKSLGVFGPISTRNANRIMDMLPGQKAKFKVANCSVSVACK